MTLGISTRQRIMEAVRGEYRPGFDSKPSSEVVPPLKRDSALTRAIRGTANYGRTYIQQSQATQEQDGNPRRDPFKILTK